MKAKELINLLKNYNPETEVKITHPGKAYVSNIEELKFDKFYERIHVVYKHKNK